MGQIRILLADRHDSVRNDTCAVLDREPDLHVTAMAASCDQALELARSSAPDVILVDSSLGMPNDGRLIRLLRQELPEAAVLVMVTYDDQCYLDAIGQAGANGCVLRNARCKDLVSLVREAGKLVTAGIPLPETVPV